jgi:uncharacterized protein (TIGR02246 family)
MSRRPMLALAALTLIAACQPAARADADAAAGAKDTTAAMAASPAAPAALSAEDEAAIKAVDQAWAAAANKGDVAALAALYTDDAELQAPDAPPVRGKAAIQAALEGLVKMKPSEVALTSHHVEGRGDLAYGTGEFTFNVGGHGAAGHFTEVFKKQADGSWKYAVDAYAMNGAPGKK